MENSEITRNLNMLLISPGRDGSVNKAMRIGKRNLRHIMRNTLIKIIELLMIEDNANISLFISSYLAMILIIGIFSQWLEH